jgi:hypothetical protein
MHAALQGCLSVLTPQWTSLRTRTGVNTIITRAQMEGRRKEDEVDGEGVRGGRAWSLALLRRVVVAFAVLVRVAHSVLV